MTRIGRTRIEILRTICLVGILATSALGVLGCQDDSAKLNHPGGQSLNYFSLGIEQDGRTIPIDGHLVELDRKPFRLVLYLEQPSGVSVHASFNSRVFQAAETGDNLAEIFQHSSAMAEELHNPHQRLFVRNDNAYHYWPLHSQTDTSHRFDPGTVRELSDGGLLCQRTVERLVAVASTGREIPVTDCEPSELYLVFFQESSEPGRDRKEKQRDWLKIRFRPTSGAQAIAACDEE